MQNIRGGFRAVYKIYNRIISFKATSPLLKKNNLQSIKYHSILRRYDWSMS